MKQIIVMRKDLGMRAGKMISQGAHASLAVTLANLTHPWVVEWLSGAFTKITVRVDSEQELFDLKAQAEDAGIPCVLITDAGRTEFNGVPTNTCIAIGPAPDAVLQEITGHLKLL